MVGVTCPALSQTTYKCGANLALSDSHYAVAPHGIQGLLLLTDCEIRCLVGQH